MLERLTLTNFKAFQSAEIPIGPLTLLSGLNSSGKSTVMQAIAMLRQSFTVGDIRATSSAAPLAGGLLLNGELVELGTAQDVLHEDYLPWGPDGVPAVAVVVNESNRGGYGWIGVYDPAQPEQDVLPLLGRVTDGGDQPVDLFQRRLQYLKADRITPATSYPRAYQVAIGKGFLGVRGEHTVNFLHHHADDEVAAPLLHHRARSALLRDQVEAWMQELCPGVNLQADGIEGTDLVRLSYGFGTAGLSSTRRRRPTNVGFGLTYVLPIVVACLTAEAGSLLMLENPEAHLHPRGQTRMAELICAAVAAGAQVIAETHSDHVLNGVRLAVKRAILAPEDTVLHYFHGNGSGVTFETPRLGKDGMLSNWPQGFFDEWEHTLDQLLD